MHAAGFIAGVLAISTLWSVAAVSAASPYGPSASAIMVDVDRQQIKPDLTSSFYCHDFDYPLIHCNRTAGNLKAAETVVFASRSAVSPNFTSADYVTIFDGAGYTGAAMDLSQNYKTCLTAHSQPLGRRRPRRQSSPEPSCQSSSASPQPARDRHEGVDRPRRAWLVLTVGSASVDR